MGLLGAATTIPAGQTITHVVKKGESLSFICIGYYGRFTPAQADTILRLNPSIKNADIIRVGTQLLLPDPKAPSQIKERAAFERSAEASQAVVTWMDGTVFTITAQGKKPCTLNAIILPGDTIQTGSDGRAELIINRETAMRLSNNTRLIIKTFRNTSKPGSVGIVETPVGQFWTKMKKFSDKVERFRLDLPVAVAGVYGTVYQTSVAADSSAEVKVYNGEVAVRNRPAGMSSGEGLSEVDGPAEVPGPHEVSMDEWVQIVRDMQRIRIDSKGKPAAVSAFTKTPGDTWEAFNEERDRHIAGLFGEIK
jgi:hypothetical protein